MANSIENVYSDFMASNLREPESFISFYERNASFFDNIAQLENKEEIRLYIEMISKYVEAIYSKGRFNLAIDIVDKKQVFIDAEIQRLNAHQLKDDWYCSLQFFKGMASYNLKDYKTAEQIFKSLTEYDGQNERFKLWLQHAQYGLNSRLVIIVEIICVGLVFTGMLFKKQISNHYVSIGMLCIGTFGFLGALIYETYMKRNFRKTKAG